MQARFHLECYNFQLLMSSEPLLRSNEGPTYHINVVKLNHKEQIPEMSHAIAGFQQFSQP